jgi:DNA-binding GntR family transcriptional regulator
MPRQKLKSHRQAASGSKRRPPQERRAIRAAHGSERLTDQAYRAIEEEIVTLRLRPGTILSEQMLAQRFKIGRTPVREALQRLANEGLVIILPRKGILVSDINPREQLLVLEARREIERLLSRASAERATDSEKTAFLKIAQGMERAANDDDDITFMRLDRELNQLMIGAARNDYAARSMRLLGGLSRRFWYMHYRETADLPLCARLHAEQSRAIANGNAKLAAGATDKLMDYVESFTRATVLGQAT